MAVINPSIASGPYELTWNGVSVGLTEGPIRFQQNAIGLPVRASLFAQNIIDYIMQGGGYFGVVVVKEWTAGSRAFMWPFGSTMGIVDEAGKLFSTYCKELVCTAVTGTPAATYGPITRTCPFAAVLPGHNLDIMFGPVERNVVVALGILPERSPSASGYKLKYLTDT